MLPLAADRQDLCAALAAASLLQEAATLLVCDQVQITDTRLHDGDRNAKRRKRQHQRLITPAFSFFAVSCDD
jgi:hypothetical protein